MTNLFSTSPEEDEECSEEYKREMGLDSTKRCSIAHFIEGSDIARKSIKCRHRKKSLDDLDTECTAVLPEKENTSEREQKVLQYDPIFSGIIDPGLEIIVLFKSFQTASDSSILEIPKIRVSMDDASVSGLSIKDNINLQIRGSHGNLTSSTDGIFLSNHEVKPDRRSYTLSETDDEEYVRFRSLSRGETIANSGSTGPTVIVDPPSPPNFVEEEESVDSENKPPNETVRRLSENCRRRKFDVASEVQLCRASIVTSNVMST